MLAPKNDSVGGNGPRPNRGVSTGRVSFPSRAGVLVFAFLAIMTLSLLGPLMTVTGGPLGGEGNVPRQAAYIICFGLAIFAVRPMTSPERLLVVPIPIAVALVWCWMSLTWAIEPGIALRRLILTTVVIWTIFILVRQLGYSRTITILRCVLVVALIANYITVLGWPQTGIHQASEPFDRALVGSWRGMMMQKNFTGLASALTVLLFAFDARRVNMIIRVIVLIAAAYFLARTSSKTSVGVCAGALLFGLAYLSVTGRYRSLVLAALGFAALAGAIYANAYEYMIFQVVGDQTFTGRTLIWKALTDYSGDHPLLGSGYGSFWNIGSSSPIYQYASNWVVKLAAGHNGFLDILVTVGVPGLLFVIVATVVWPAIRLFSVAAGQQGALIAAIFLFCVVHNMAETSLFDRDTMGEVFLMIAIALIGTVSAPQSYRRFNLNKSKAGTRPSYL